MIGDIFETLLDGSLLITLPIALAGGVVSFLSPCVLPLVPGYLGLLGSLGGEPPVRRHGQARGASAANPEALVAKRRRGRMLTGVALFIVGFTIVFVLMNAIAGGVGSALIANRGLIVRILGVVVILAGLVYIGRVSFLQQSFSLPQREWGGVWAAPLIGAAFAIGWTPCSGAVLAAIGTLSLTSGSSALGALYGLMYGIGLGIPFMLIALGFDWMARISEWVRQHTREISMVGGFTLVTVGALMVSGLWMRAMDAMAGWINSVQTLI